MIIIFENKTENVIEVLKLKYRFYIELKRFKKFIYLPHNQYVYSDVLY